jgi:gamma-glutamyltranspeptidase/glutathione hydrolase
MTRSLSAAGSRYAVASGCPDATATAASILEQGGNIIDAAIAGSAVQCVTSPHLVSVGGDLLCVVKFAGEPQAIALNAVGRAPRRADIETYKRLGHSLVPVRGPLSVQTPGLVLGWHTLHQRWASKPLAALLEPAVQLAGSGFTVGSRLAKLSVEHLEACKREHGWSDTFLVDGRTAREGELLKQERLAATLDRIRTDGADAFYRGPIARDIVDTVRKTGGLLELDDMATMTARFAPALTTAFAGMTVATQPPVSQGVVLLRALSLLQHEVDGGLEHDPVALWPVAAKAFKTAFAERLALLGDGPDARTRAEIMLAGGISASDQRPLHAHAGPETTTLSIIDGQGNAIALINSVFGDFGSGIVTDEGGILLNNRATGFFLDPRHPNALAPGKSTMHTLHSVIVSDAHGVRMAGGSPGGDHQPQVNLQVLTRTLLLGDTLENAAAAPRWHLHPGTHPHQLAAQKTSTVRFEPGVPEAVREAFAKAGFRTEPTPDIGSAKWVSRAPSGNALIAAADRRRDGAVAAH